MIEKLMALLMLLAVGLAVNLNVEEEDKMVESPSFLEEVEQAVAQDQGGESKTLQMLLDVDLPADEVEDESEGAASSA